MLAAAAHADGPAVEKPSRHAFGGPPRGITLPRDEATKARLRALVDLQNLGYTDAELRAVLKLRRTAFQDACRKVRGIVLGGMGGDC